MSEDLRDIFSKAGIDFNSAQELIEKALQEDIRRQGDVTSNAIFTGEEISTAQYRSRKEGVISGLPLVALVFHILGEENYKFIVNDGAKVKSGEVLMEITGNTKKILLAERTSLNLLTHLSGIATLTNQWVAEISTTKAKIRDTRKTIPGLRNLEKYAVRTGGGVNHRMDLSDAALIKDNHIAAAGSITNAFKRIKERYPDLTVEIEVDNLTQYNEAVLLNPELILLDNFSPELCKEAVAIKLSNHESKIKLEASGGITLDSALAYAQTGVDYLAVGALTHSAPTLDIGLDFKVI